MAAETPPRRVAAPSAQVTSALSLIARVAGTVILIWAVVAGTPSLEWIAAGVMSWFVVVVWGRHILLIDNLNALPDLSKVAPPTTAAGQSVPLVTVVVPVRNEATGIEPAALALAASDYPELEVIYVDDHSTDQTAAVLRRLAPQYPRVRVISAPDVPAGWTGKIHASWFAFEQSDSKARWLLFTDARVMYRQDAISRAIAHAESKQLAFLSGIVRFDGETFAEQSLALIQNRGLITVARAFGGGAPVVPFGLGGFSLVRRDVYLAVGGHAASPGHATEDFMLADSVRRTGAKVSVANASGLLWIRRYRGFKDLRQRVVRTFRLAASDRILPLVSRASVEFCFYVLPLLLVMASIARMLLVDHHLRLALVVLSALAVLTYAAGALTARTCRKTCRVRPSAVWLYPLGSTLATYLLLLAIAERLRGVNIDWRGRVISASPPIAG